MIPLLACVVERAGIVGIYDASGVSRSDEQLLVGLAGEGGLLHGQEASREADSGGAVLCGEVFNLATAAHELGLSPTTPGNDVVEFGFRRWSNALVTHLRGSFAFVAVADGRALVAADASAGHSIVYQARGSRLVFSSEIHLLLKLLPTRPAPNGNCLVHWLADGTSPPVGETLYESVSELIGGECIELTSEGWVRSRCWTPRYEAPQDMSRQEAGALLWEALVGSVGARLERDRHVGIVMSSGIDSSAVAAAAVAAAAPELSRIRSYSAVFPDDPDLDESDRIVQLVARLGIENTRIPAEPGHACDYSLEWLAAWELPLYDLGYQLERPLLDLAASEDVRGVLDGQWGDESFGAPTYLPADFLRRGRILESVRVARLLRANHFVGGQRPWRSYAFMGALPLGLERRYLRLRPSMPNYLTSSSARLVVDTDSARNWKTVPAPRWWAEKMYLLAVDRQASGISAYVRQRAALSGLTARPPLFDVPVMETLLRIPPEVEFDPTFDRAIVREAMAGHIPEALRTSPWKSDAGPFYLAGLAGPDLERIREVLSNPREVGAYAKPDVIRTMIENPPRWSDPGARAWVLGVWKLVTAECWLRFQADRGLPERLLGHRAGRGKRP